MACLLGVIVMRGEDAAHKPENTQSIEKRVRRHVRAQIHSFYAVCQPGFEEECREEISRITSLECFASEGGVAFRGRIESLYLASLHSYCAVRFLMRIARFRADNFDYFKKSFSEIPWELYLPADCRAEFSISCRKSRLMHTGRLEQDAADALSKFGFSGENTQRLHIRFFRDICTVSLDASGDALYRRSYRTQVADAPLRETSASLILAHARVRDYEALVDPMAGSGVFTIEAFMQSRAMIPQLQHTFPFSAWPVFSEKMFLHARTARFAEAFPLLLHASDIDPRCVRIMENNFALCGVECTPVCADFFSLENPFQGKRTLVVLNPPYGERLAQQEPEQFYRRIFIHLKKAYTGCGIAIVIPRHIVDKCGSELPFTDRVEFHNGDINTAVLFGKL